MLTRWASLAKTSAGESTKRADFRSIQPGRHVEIYLANVAFRHAIYMFSNRAVLALYALCGERIPTPAFLVSDGRLLSFMRADFDRLLAQSDRVS